MYLVRTCIHSQCRKVVDSYSPDGTGLATVDYGLGHLERLFKLILRSRGDRLFDEQRSLREVLQDLELDIAARARGTTEHWGRDDENGVRTFAMRHILDKVLEGLEDASVVICGTYEGFAFLGEDCGGTVDGGIDEGNDLETGTELTGGVGECECTEGVKAEKTHCSMRKE